MQANPTRFPVFKDPNTTVRILLPIRVGGKEFEAGSKATMSLSDAQALAGSKPPTVEII